MNWKNNMSSLINSSYEDIDFAIEDLAKNPNLNRWEKTFVDDIKIYVKQGGFLSERQLNILNEIWEKY